MPDLKVVYCLTYSGGDIYEAMTRVAFVTLRLTNANANDTMACDQQAHQALQASGSQLFHEADGARLSHTRWPAHLPQALCQSQGAGCSGLWIWQCLVVSPCH